LLKDKDKKKKLKVETPSFHRKKITVVCVNNETFTTPGRKARDALVKEGKIKEMYAGKNENQNELFDKICRLFPKTSIELLKVTAAKDLLPIDISEIESILEVLDGSNLYVRDRKRENGHCTIQ